MSEKPDIPRVSASDDTAIAGALDEAGCCVVEAAVPATVMDALIADMAPYVQDTPVAPATSLGPAPAEPGWSSADRRPFVIISRCTQR